MLLIAVGAALGGMARYGVSLALARPGFPWPTLLVNLAGSLVIGWLFGSGAPPEGVRFFVAIGFLGAFTTLSAYSLETMDLARAGAWGMATGNIVANALGGPLLALVGWRIAAWTT